MVALIIRVGNDRCLGFLLYCPVWNLVVIFWRFRNGEKSFMAGKEIGIGQTLMRSLILYQDTQGPYQSSTSTKQAGNSCIMRLVPSVIANAKNLDLAVGGSVLQSRTIHPAVALVVFGPQAY